MNLGFWGQLAKPLFVLAPMADVTDSAFRQIVAKYGKPDAFFTEFVSTDGLCSDGRENVMMDLYFTESERPIVAQIWGRNPEHFYQSALLLQKLGFDGIDINMGCPDANVCKQGGGVALLKEPELAQTIIRETKRGAGKLPVSVKTRIGFNTDILEECIPQLLEAEPALITVHGRTKKEMSDVPAHWDRIGLAAKIARSRGSETLILGNGDVQTLKEAQEKARTHGLDGIMMGRGILGNPWLFNRDKNCSNLHFLSQYFSKKRAGEFDRSIQERMRVMIEHTFLFEKLYVGKNFAIMKKHFKAYVSGFSHAKELRIRLMEAENAREVEEIVNSMLGKV